MGEHNHSLHIVLWVTFALGFATLFWQYFEFAYKLQVHGVIESAVWSGTFGYPVLHHGYFGAVLAIGSLLFIQIVTWRER